MGCSGRHCDGSSEARVSGRYTNIVYSRYATPHTPEDAPVGKAFRVVTNVVLVFSFDNESL